VEGVEGCGKSTHAGFLARRLRARGYRVLLTAEPGGSAAGKSIRECLLTPRGHVGPLAELFLFEADRSQHVREVIRPALARGAIVVCDRFSDSSRAYQGVGRGLGLRLVNAVDRMATGGLRPDLTLLLDVPVRRGVERARKRGALTRLDRESLAFHGKVRRAFLNLAARSGGRFHVIGALGPASETAAAVDCAVASALRRKGLA